MGIVQELDGACVTVFAWIGQWNYDFSALNKNIKIVWCQQQL